MPKGNKAGAVSDSLVAAMDLLPTLVELCDATGPAQWIDGVSFSALLEDPTAPALRTHLFHFQKGELNAVRRGPWKLILPHHHVTYEGVERGKDGQRGPHKVRRSKLGLFNLDLDPEESSDVSSEHPDIVRELTRLADEARTDLGRRRDGQGARGVRPPGKLPPTRVHPPDHLARDGQVELDRAPDSPYVCLLYTSPSPRDQRGSRMPSSA